MQFTSYNWFPSGIFTKLGAAKEILPNLSEFKVHTKHGTLNMLWPKLEPLHIDFWKKIDDLIDNENIKSWGVASNFNFKKITNVTVLDDKNNITLLIEGNKNLIAKFYPFLVNSRESKFRKMDLEDVKVRVLGGLKYQNHNLVTFYEEDIVTNNFEKHINNCLANSKLNDLEIQLKEIGLLLGRFHTLMNENVAPPIPEKWNERLKRLEHVTSSNTLWRAPHSKFTEAILTHGNLSLDKIILDSDNKWKLIDFEGMKLQTLIDSTTRFPAIRDLANIYWSISKIMNDLEIYDNELEKNMRMWLFESWLSKAPKKWSNSNSLDTHKGGIMIWEYDCALYELFTEQAFEGENKIYTKKWLSNVTRIQAIMFKNRIYSALSKISIAIGLMLLIGWNSIDQSLIFLGMFAAFSMSWAFNRIYNSRAPNNWSD